MKKKIKLKPKTTAWTSAGRRAIKKRMKDFKESAASIYHYEHEDDTQIIEYIMMPAIALRWKDKNPVWAQIIGAPSSGKTAHIGLYEGHPLVKMVSRLSANSLISGYRSEEDPEDDPSFILELNQKLLIVKDFTTILQSPKVERDAVIGQLRDIFDGSASRVFGTIGLQEYKVKFNMLLAVTPEIDKQSAVNQQLGERFISRREYGRGRNVLTSMAFDNGLAGRNKKALDDLRLDFQDMLGRLPNIPMAGVEWPKEMRDKAILGADFIARCRSSVTRERDGRSIAGRPSPELGGRLVTQVQQCVASQSIATGNDIVKSRAWNFGGAKILRDTIPSSISWVLFHMYQIRKSSRMPQGPWFTVKDLLQTKMGYKTIDTITSNMYHNGLLEGKFIGATGRKMPKYRLNDYAYEVLLNTGLFKGYSRDESGLKEIKTLIKNREKKRSKKEKSLRNIG